jgi:hypothetical protein
MYPFRTFKSTLGKSLYIYMNTGTQPVISTTTIY